MRVYLQSSLVSTLRCLLLGALRLFAQAAAGDVKAASLYLQYIEKFTPKRRLVVDDERAVSGLSDSELADELEALVAEFRPESEDVEVDEVVDV